MYNHETSDVLDIMHRWLDYHLYGMDNGVLEDVANVIVQNNLNQNVWIESDGFPPEGNVMYKFPVAMDGIKEFVDNIEITNFEVDDQKSDIKGNIAWREELILPMDEEKPHEIKIVVAPEFEGGTKRISGTVKISFEAALDKETGILSAMLVDYGLDKRITLKEEVVKEKGRVWGRNTETADIVKFKYEEESSEYRIISRGWINAQNVNNNYSKVALVDGEYNAYSFDMIPTDYTFKCNHKLGLIIYGTDPEETVRRTKTTKVMVKLNTIDVNIPVV
ncbi:MAG: hypothetical protein JJE03_06890 [Peptostreptococcaceae bacterium]|nr:hypothetical protein [Peptostreptococcaceae bacterium]